MRLDLGGGRWWKVDRDDPRARALADRHYSRQTVGAHDFMPPGKTLVLLTDDERAVWGACENLDPRGRPAWRVTIFRNEGAGLSSELVRGATAETLLYWLRKFGPGALRLRTEIDAGKVRAKRDPGRCFLRAGWKVTRHRYGLVHLAAPRFREALTGKPRRK